MRIFYVFWFFFCAGWGYLLATFPPQEGLSWVNVLATFPVAMFFLCLVAFVELRRKSVPAESARLSPNLKPWQQPLGVLQFVTVTFIFSGTWGIILSLSLQGAYALYPFQVLAMSAGGLLGTWAACRVHRSTRVA